MTGNATTTEPITILAVIVLYRCAVADSASITSILRAVEDAEVDLRLFVVDNSPLAQDTSSISAKMTYLHCPENLGLANAYNRAVEFAEGNGYAWLLTLDQDTGLPEDFLRGVAGAIRQCQQSQEVAAILPQIVAHGKVISPNYFKAGALARWFAPGYTGVPPVRTFGFNSAATLRVSAIRQAGGYDPYFWLDNSDAAIFDALQRFGKKVFVAGGIKVEHDFSMMDMGQRVPPWRYRHILLAETAFWDRRMNRLAGWERRARLVVRLLKHRMRNDSADLRALTRQSLWDRLVHSKAYRRRAFEQAVEQHLGARLAGTGLEPRPTKVSVCMAAYNGGHYVDLQLRSILDQLRPWDEVVIVDDCSKDDTAARIEAMGDPRIRLVRHLQNAGVVRTFEDALRAATGDVLFLSDDDDIWAANKVERMLAAFAADPGVMIVTSRVAIVDEHGEPMPGGRFDRGSRFHAGFWRNVWKNHYQGSAMAVRASLLEHVLPFPVRPAFLHDVWVGTRSDAMGGKTVFVDESLLLYRRHSGNFSKHLSRGKQIKLRVALIWAHLRVVLGLS